MEDCFEKISFGKIKSKLGKNKYNIFHEIPSYGEFSDSNRFLSEINYDNLVGYLMGVSSGKSKGDFCLYNGISDKIKKENLIGANFVKLKNNELERLLKDSFIDNLFSVDDIKDV